jgi:S1-C subfamily serine protease
VTVVDWIALGIVAIAALAGMQRGLVLSAFSLVGLALGAYVGSRVAPHLLSGGADSVWTPLAGLVGAVIGAGLLQILGVVAGSYLRGGLRVTPLRVLDSAGGLLLGIVTGLGIVWVGAAVVHQAPKRLAFRHDVQRSWIVRELNAALPPRLLVPLLHAIDPIGSISGPPAPTLPPAEGVLKNPRIRDSLTRVVKVIGTACGAGVEGSGWFAGEDLVVTAAHVVAGERATSVEIPDDANSHRATVVVFDPHNDIAILRVSGATASPLRSADPIPDSSVVIAGYPLDGSLTVIPGRVGGTTNAFVEDAYKRKVVRAITAVSGRVQPGDSGGPVIDTRGRVVGTTFAVKKKGSKNGYAVPTSIVRADLATVGKRAVSTEGCAPP